MSIEIVEPKAETETADQPQEVGTMTLGGDNNGDRAAEAAKLNEELIGSMPSEEPESPTTSEDEAGPDGDEPTEPTEQPDGEQSDEAGDEPKGEKIGKGWQAGSWRRKRRELREREEQVQAQEAAVYQAQQQVQQAQAEAQQHAAVVAEIRQLGATSPAAAAAKFAELTGQNADDLYERWTKAKVLGETEPQPPKDPATVQLEQRLAELEAQQKKNVEAQQQQQIALALQSDCAQVYAVAAAVGDEKLPKYPYLATMPDQPRDDLIATAVPLAIAAQRQDGRQRDHDFVARVLDEQRMEELRFQLQTLPSEALQAILPAGITVPKGRTAQGNGDSAGSASRDQGSKRGNRGIGNSAASQTSTGARPADPEAMRRKLDEELRASMPD